MAEIMSGGTENAGQVERIGDTIHRPRGPGHQVVEALLLHLESVGYPHAPRFLGVDELGRQIVSFMDGVADDAYGLDDRSSLPEMMAICTEDAISWWRSSQTAEELAAWQWRADWVRENGDWLLSHGGRPPTHAGRHTL